MLNIDFLLNQAERLLNARDGYKAKIDAYRVYQEYRKIENLERMAEEAEEAADSILRQIEAYEKSRKEVLG